MLCVCRMATRYTSMSKFRVNIRYKCEIGLVNGCHLNAPLRHRRNSSGQAKIIGYLLCKAVGSM